ncbi:MAG: hypothetical protein KDK78_08680, partial [Chlamydiia bacterium]|nr:hypothetical protein [Chlamydiia bacterium]
MQKINIITNDLSEIKASDKDLFGAKASLLAAVHGHGYGTPGGYALSLPRRSPIEAEELLAMVEDCTGPTAVRSSSVWEDGASASGAGCFLTRLHCVGSDAILQAVIDVYTHAKGVADAQGLDGDRIGVLIQPMVPGSISVVCFTF